jgi:hypothetical protein
MKSPHLLRRFSFVLMFGLIGSTEMLHAATLASYQFTSASVSSTASSVTGGNASWILSAGTSGFGGGSNSAFAATSTMTTALNSSKYMTFTLTAANGQMLDLSSLTFDFGGNTSSSTSAALSARLLTSVDGFTNAVTLNGSTTTATHQILTTDSAVRYTSYTADLSAPAYDNLSSITFQFLVAASANNTTLFLRFDNIAVDGAVLSSVPEPATMSLLAGVAALGLVVSRRRFRTK